MPRYSATQRRMRGLGGRSKRKFLRLYTNVKTSRAYHGLSLYGRALLFEILARYTGINNGMIGLGVREAAYEMRCSQGSITKAMREIDDAGLARPTKLGDYRGKKATEWRLMFLRCDKTGEGAVEQWEQRTPHSLFTTGSTKVHVGKHRDADSSRGEAQTRNSSMKCQTLCSRGDAHIDVYQVPTERGGGTEQGIDTDSESTSQPASECKEGAQNNFGPRSATRRAS